MRQDHFTYQQAARVAGFGLLVQASVGVAALLFGVGAGRLGSIGLGLDLARSGGLGGVVAVVPTAQVGAFGSARTRRHRRWRVGLDRR